MTQRTLPTGRANAGTPWESYFVLASVTLLSGLAVADRFAAWLIGKFPTSAALWELRFEYLRPIGVYYDLAELNFGSWSPWTFSILVLGAWALIAGGAFSRLRLARAAACHLLFIAAASLVVLCFDRGLSIQPRAIIGTPSESYFLFGALLASVAAVLCLRIHAEYLGWDPASSHTVRRLQLSAARLRSTVGDAAFEIVQQLGPVASQSRPAFVRADRRSDRRTQQFTPDQ